MADLPRSLSKFEQRFGDEVACAQNLATLRWPDGFTHPRLWPPDLCHGRNHYAPLQAAALNLVLGRL